MSAAYFVAAATVPLLPSCREGFLALLQLWAEVTLLGHHYRFNHRLSKAKQVPNKTSMSHVFQIKTLHHLLLHASITSLPEIKEELHLSANALLGKKSLSGSNRKLVSYPSRIWRGKGWKSTLLYIDTSEHLFGFFLIPNWCYNQILLFL